MPTIDAHPPAPATADADVLPDPVVVDPAERQALLDLARAALAVAVGTARNDVLDEALACAHAFGRTAAAFVTLTEDGELRGCMGSLDDRRSVADSVASAAFLAATRDPRFRPVAVSELPRIHLEVSVLGPIVPLAEPERFRLGIDGVIVERGPWRGLLLPEVAEMLGWDRLEMLDTTCLKAGLSRGAWRERGTSVSAFRTVRFGGPALEPESTTT